MDILTAILFGLGGVLFVVMQALSLIAIFTYWGKRHGR